MARLSHVSNIVGIKDATADLAQLTRMLLLCGERLEFYSGDDATSLELILEGAVGTISVTANVVPGQLSEMCRLALAGVLITPGLFSMTQAAILWQLPGFPQPTRLLVPILT